MPSRATAIPAVSPWIAHLPFSAPVPFSGGPSATKLPGSQAESAWSNGKPAYRCRHGHTTASAPDPSRPKNAYVREDRIVPHLPALHLLLTGPAGETRRRRTRRGTDVRSQAPEDVICYLREQQVTVTYDPAAGTLHAGTGEGAQTITLKAS
jgi:site-specific DNA recombinase